MPRDFKQPRARRKSPRPPPRPPRRSAGAARWPWFVTGVCVGAAATAGVFLYEPGPARRADATPPAATADGGGTPRFEFYTLLPEKEIAIPDTELDRPAARATAAPSAADGGARYLLQVGSFRKLEDADRLKARLAFLGLEAGIQTVSIDGTETWHRVRVGPYSGRAELDEARSRLKENRFDALLLKLK